MVWKCVYGVAPAYLSDLCVPATAISGRQYLQQLHGTLLVPRAWTATEQRSFEVNGPATWNRLPRALRSPDLSESSFKRALKTHLFSTTRRHWDVFMIVAPDINIQTYLLTYLLIYLLTVHHAVRIRNIKRCKLNVFIYSLSVLSLINPTHCDH